MIRISLYTYIYIYIIIISYLWTHSQLTQLTGAERFERSKYALERIGGSIVGSLGRLQIWMLHKTDVWIFPSWCCMEKHIHNMILKYQTVSLQKNRLKLDKHLHLEITEMSGDICDGGWIRFNDHWISLLLTALHHACVLQAWGCSASKSGSNNRRNRWVVLQRRVKLIETMIWLFFDILKRFTVSDDRHP